MHFKRTDPNSTQFLSTEAISLISFAPKHKTNELSSRWELNKRKGMKWLKGSANNICVWTWDRNGARWTNARPVNYDVCLNRLNYWKCEKELRSRQLWWFVHQIKLSLYKNTLKIIIANGIPNDFLFCLLPMLK